jgi:hypothetical protein
MADAKTAAVRIWEKYHGRPYPSLNPSAASSTETPTPADYGQQSGAVRRAAGVAAMTVEQRAMYRRGYQAHAQAVSRWRRRVLQVLRSQLL